MRLAGLKLNRNERRIPEESAPGSDLKPVLPPTRYETSHSDQSQFAVEQKLSDVGVAFLVYGVWITLTR